MIIFNTYFITINCYTVIKTMIIIIDFKNIHIRDINLAGIDEISSFAFQ